MSEDEHVKIEDESDDDMPIARRKKAKHVIKDEDGEEESAPDKPVEASSSKPAGKRVRDDEDEDDDDDDVPVSKMKKTEKAPAKVKAEPVKKEKEVPVKKEKEAPKKKEAPAKKPAAKKKKEESGSESEEVEVEDDEESESDFEDEDSDAPKGKKKAPAKKPAPKKPAAAAAKKAAPAAKKAAPAKKKKAASSDEDDSSSEEESASDSDAKPKKKAPAKKAAAKPKAAPKAKAAAKKKKKGSDDDDSSSSSGEDSDDVPLSQRKADKGKKAGKGAAGKKGETEGKKERISKVKQEEEFIWKWWLPEEQDIIKMKEEKGIKWITLEHAGVMFPEEYKPHGVKMLYNGKPIELRPEEEEVATFYAGMLDSDYTKKDRFNDNFFKCWLEVLNKGRKKSDRHPIQDLGKCDFTPIYTYLKEEREKKKAMSKEEKKALKERRDAVEARFKIAMVDGHKEKVGNFKIEPPGLFRGRGEHPKMGMLKRRVTPEEVTINIGKDVPCPEPPPGHRWEKVIHDNTVTWLAHWKDTINDQDKYVWLAATSSFKGMADFNKYENARKLKDYIDDIRENYTADLKSKEWVTRQRACAVYLIDRLALRAGNEKDTEEEADTVGCCSLRVEHITFNDETGEITLDFLGKDSMQYLNTVKVETAVYKNLKEFAAKDAGGSRKDPGDDLFDKLDTSSLNKHLKDLMPGLTAKVFRTFNASITLDRLLHEAGDVTDMSPNDRLVKYNDANREVAILCNHQRSVPKNHQEMMGKLDDRMKEMVEERERYEKYAKKCKKEGEITITEEIKSKKKKDAAGKKGKDEEEDEEDGPKERTKKLDEEKCKKHIANLTKRINNLEAQRRIKDDNKTVALGTSKINYMDPRITVAWCKKNEVPINKIFNASLQTKFMWALDVEPEFRF